MENGSNLPSIPNGDIRRLASFYEMVSGKTERKFERQKTYKDAVIIVDENIRKIFEIFTDGISESEAFVATSCAVYAADGSLVRYNDLEQLIEMAGEAEPPKYCTIELSNISYGKEEYVTLRTIRIAVNSYHPKKTIDDILNPVSGSISVSVSGSDQLWVDSTYRRVCGVLDTARHGGYLNFIRKFYNFLKSDGFERLVPVLMMIVSMFGGIAGIHYTLSKPLESKKEAVLERITSSAEIVEKFDAYAGYALASSDAGSRMFWLLVAMGISAALALGLFSYALPKAFQLLSPPTFIAVGESRSMCERRLSNHRSVANAVIISGLGFPLVWFLIAVVFAR